MKNISYLLSLLLAFSFVSFADEEVKEAPKESEEVGEEVTEESSSEEAEEDKEPTISEFIEETNENISDDINFYGDKFCDRANGLIYGYFLELFIFNPNSLRYNVSSASSAVLSDL